MAYCSTSQLRSWPQIHYCVFPHLFMFSDKSFLLMDIDMSFIQYEDVNSKPYAGLFAGGMLVLLLISRNRSVPVWSVPSLWSHLRDKQTRHTLLNLRYNSEHHESSDHWRSLKTFETQLLCNLNTMLSPLRVAPQLPTKINFSNKIYNILYKLYFHWKTQHPWAETNEMLIKLLYFRHMNSLHMKHFA